MDSVNIQNRIFVSRGHRIMIDFHLSELYGVQTRALNQAVKRNLRRFPDDFMFQLTTKEWEAIKNEMAISAADTLVATGSRQRLSQIVTASRNLKNLPYAFTEPGVAMLSSVLKSDRAIDVNITTIRTFIMLRQYISNYTELSNKVSALEKQMNRKFKDIHEALNYLMDTSPPSEIGFKQATKNP
jgi:hypothetical protein